MRQKLFAFLHLFCLFSHARSSFLLRDILDDEAVSGPTTPLPKPQCNLNVTCPNHWEIVFAVITDNADSYINFSKQIDAMSSYCSSDNTALFLSPEKIRQETNNLCQTAKYKKDYFAGQSEKYPFDEEVDVIVTNDTLLQLLDKISYCVPQSQQQNKQGVLFIMTDIVCNVISPLDQFDHVFDLGYQVNIYEKKQCNISCTSRVSSRCKVYDSLPTERICPIHKISTVDLAILIAVGIALLIMLIVLFFYIRMRNKKKLMKRIRERAKTREHRAATEKSLKPRDPWELQQDELEIFVEKELGRGAFAIVFEGKLKGRRPVDEVIPTAQLMSNRNDMVAVKRVPPHADVLARRDFLDEIEFMKKLGYHAHVLGMIGCMTSVDLPLIVLEYCENGDLLEFLKNNRSDLEEGNGAVKPKDLLSIAWQISDGMVYLKSLDLIHRDLAARNILLNKNLSAKISDFGLCRQPATSESSAIYISRGGRLPVKWMAIESLRDFHFSLKSDVWSFGVVLWELFSFGEVPYGDVHPTAMLEVLMAGQRLPQLSTIPESMYKLMSECWEAEPDERKDIEELRDTLNEALASSSLYYGYLTMSDKSIEDLN